MLIVQRVSQRREWASVQARGKMPVGVSMALATVAFLVSL